MFTKKEYEKFIPTMKEMREEVKKDKYRLAYHIMPPTGWLNDPNGLCQHRGVNHIYYQYTPQTPSWGIKSWGHYTTKNWVEYHEEEPFLFADSIYDCDGVYSGSAFVEDDKIHYFYTGNVKYNDKEYDYITSGREQNTVLVTSTDGFTFDKKHLVLQNTDYPEDMSVHVRDPKIYKKNQKYYMVLGARSNQDTGCVLLYVSDDLVTWEYHMRIESKIPFGYMWECPDLFDIEDKTFLVCCPQGVEQKGIDYANVYQMGYFEVKLDLENKSYELSDFVELDRGFDIYAPQSFLDEQGRRILIAWMGIPDASYHNDKTVEHQWQHALTLPRQLCLEEGYLVSKPLEEFKQLRTHAKGISMKNQGEEITPALYEAELNFSTCETIELQLHEGIHLHYKNHILTLKFTECGCGRDRRSVVVDDLCKLQIFMDASSIEIFVNDGREVFTSRHYANQISKLKLQGVFEMVGTIYELKPFTLVK
ncbi:glycoside hydrolase family 32 protein [Amedibacillus sp. YH-ame6]